MWPSLCLNLRVYILQPTCKSEYHQPTGVSHQGWVSNTKRLTESTVIHASIADNGTYAAVKLMSVLQLGTHLLYITLPWHVTGRASINTMSSGRAWVGRRFRNSLRMVSFTKSTLVTTKRINFSWLYHVTAQDSTWWSSSATWKRDYPHLLMGTPRNGLLNAWICCPVPI